jgi:hypothetical protein
VKRAPVVQVQQQVLPPGFDAIDSRPHERGGVAVVGA